MIIHFRGKKMLIPGTQGRKGGFGGRMEGGPVGWMGTDGRGDRGTDGGCRSYLFFLNLAS